MSGSQQWTYKFVLEKRQIWAVEDALAHCQTLCDQGQAPGRPFWTDGNDVKVIRKKLWTFLVPIEMRGEIWSNPSIHKNLWLQMNVELEEEDMMGLDAMLSCYQAHCREQTGADAGWYRVSGEDIGTIRRRMWACPPAPK
jgi:hypothetical protein